jgi:adenine-specific DNA-methyltransferase
LLEFAHDVAADGGKLYVVQTPTRVVERCILITTDPGDLVLDPTCGSGTTAYVADIACWFIDTDYNGESFFVRHAYFTGADEPYEKLKRALRADINEEAWQSLYSTVSRPFDEPGSGKIAVKVINHFGDEMLKVFEV